jgi:outer membrane receptor protein involved in Fe transport
LQYRPRHKVSLEGRYRFEFGFGTALSIVHVADQVFYSRQEPIEQGKLPSYTLVDARVAQRLGVGPPVKLYLGVDNLFDQAYEEAYGFPQAGRTVYGGVDLRF